MAWRPGGFFKVFQSTKNSSLFYHPSDSEWTCLGLLSFGLRTWTVAHEMTLFKIGLRVSWPKNRDHNSTHSTNSDFPAPSFLAAAHHSIVGDSPVSHIMSHPFRRHSVDTSKTCGQDSQNRAVWDLEYLKGDCQRVGWRLKAFLLQETCIFDGKFHGFP